ncbi:MAG: M20/M25/M40 family metallo-hydrolase, partial [Bacteroidales bacterium]|nr:M20/M25/M40 family metallo-hydrolase [Bacteroidales bacterium]
MEKVKAYIESNKDRFLEELFGLIRIPSISSLSDHKADMVRAAEYWRDSILQAGADKAEVMPTDGNPVVYGEKIINPALPTVLVYGHYDVMPVDPIELWDSPPFEPEVRDGKIWARGADDDKGQA